MEMARAESQSARESDRPAAPIIRSESALASTKLALQSGQRSSPLVPSASPLVGGEPSLGEHIIAKELSSACLHAFDSIKLAIRGHVSMSASPRSSQLSKPAKRFHQLALMAASCHDQLLHSAHTLLQVAINGEQSNETIRAVEAEEEKASLRQLFPHVTLSHFPHMSHLILTPF